MVLLDPHAQVEVGSGRSGVRASSSPAQPGNHLLEDGLEVLELILF